MIIMPMKFQLVTPSMIMRYRNFSLEHLWSLMWFPLSLSILVKPLQSKSVQSPRVSYLQNLQRERKGIRGERTHRDRKNFRREGSIGREESAWDRSSPRDGSHFHGEETRGERERERETSRERSGVGERERERGRRKEKGGREEDFPPPASSRNGRNFHREKTQGERKHVGEKKGLLPAVPSRWK